MQIVELTSTFAATTNKPRVTTPLFTPTHFEGFVSILDGKLTEIPCDCRIGYSHQ